MKKYFILCLARKLSLPKAKIIVVWENMTFLCILRQSGNGVRNVLLIFKRLTNQVWIFEHLRQQMYFLQEERSSKTYVFVNKQTNKKRFVFVLEFMEVSFCFLQHSHPASDETKTRLKFAPRKCLDKTNNQSSNLRAKTNGTETSWSFTNLQIEFEEGKSGRQTKAFQTDGPGSRWTSSTLNRHWLSINLSQTFHIFMHGFKYLAANIKMNVVALFP